MRIKIETDEKKNWRNNCFYMKVSQLKTCSWQA